MSTKDISDLEVLEACRDWRTHHQFADALLAVRTEQHPKVAHRALERADRRRLIEWGVSLRTAWPTPEGFALLEQHGKPATAVELSPDGDGCIGVQVLCTAGGELRSAWYRPVLLQHWRQAAQDPSFLMVLQVDLRILLEQDDLQVLAMAPFTLRPETPTV